MEITVTELKTRQGNKEDLLIFDVREVWEFEESKIPGTKNLPLYSIPDSINDLKKHLADEIIVYCRTGVRGNTARAVLNQHGFNNVKNLVGGIVAYFENN